MGVENKTDCFKSKKTGSLHSKIPVLFKSPRNKIVRSVRSNIVCSTPVNTIRKSLFEDADQKMSPIRGPSSTATSSNNSAVKLIENENELKSKQIDNNKIIDLVEPSKSEMQQTYNFPLVRNIPRLTMQICDSEDEIFPRITKPVVNINNFDDEPIQIDSKISSKNSEKQITTENGEIMKTQSKSYIHNGENIENTHQNVDKKISKTNTFSSAKNSNSKRSKSSKNQNTQNFAAERDSGDKIIDLETKMEDVKGIINCKASTGSKKIKDPCVDLSKNNASLKTQTVSSTISKNAITNKVSEIEEVSNSYDDSKTHNNNISGLNNVSSVINRENFEDYSTTPKNETKSPKRYRTRSMDPKKKLEVLPNSENTVKSRARIGLMNASGTHVNNISISKSSKERANIEKAIKKSGPNTDKKSATEEDNQKVRRSGRKRMPTSQYFLCSGVSNTEEDIKFKKPSIIKKITSKSTEKLITEQIENVSKGDVNVRKESSAGKFRFSFHNLENESGKLREGIKKIEKPQTIPLALTTVSKDASPCRQSIISHKLTKKKKQSTPKVLTMTKIRRSLVLKKKMNTPKKNLKKTIIEEQISEPENNGTTETENSVPRDTLLLINEKNNERDEFLIQHGLKRKVDNKLETYGPKKAKIQTRNQEFCFKSLALQADASSGRAGGLADVQINGKLCLLGCFGKFPRNLNQNMQNPDISVGISISNEYITTGILEIEPDGRKKYEYAKRCDLLFIILAGIAEVGIGNCSKVLRLGQDFYVPRGTSYYILNVSSTDKVLLHFSKLDNK